MKCFLFFAGMSATNAMLGVANLSVGNLGNFAIGAGGICVAIACGVCAAVELKDPIA